MLRKLIRNNLDDLLLFIGVEGGLFLLVEVIICCVMYFVRPTDSISIAWIMLPLAAGFVALVTVIGHAAVTFDLALRFGQTRRRALGLFLGLSAFETAFGLVLAVPLCALERFVCPALWARLAGLDGWALAKTGVIAQAPLPDIPGMEPEPGRYFVNAAGELARLPERTLLVNDFTLAWYWWLLIFAAALAMGIVIGALLQRFGQKGLWAVWGCWMALILGPQIIPSDVLELPGWLIRLSPMLLPLLAGVLVVGFLLWSVWSMLHAVVRS